MIMTDNTQAKRHLIDTETKLNDLSNISEINRITAARSLELFNNLHTGNNLFVDDEVKTNIQNIYNRLDAGAIVTEARAEIVDLNTEEAALPAVASSNGRRTEIGKERRNLLKITWGTAAAPGAVWHANIINRRTEYTNLRTYANYFNTGNRVNNIDVDITVWPPRVWPNINQNLDLLFKTAPGNPNANYTLCDDQGIVLPQPTPGNYTIQVGWQTATIGWIFFAGRSLDLRNITITPPNTDISQALKLSINATYPAATIGVNNINLVCNKKFELQLRNWPAPVPVNTPALRNGVVDTYNTRVPINSVTNEITSTYTNRFPTLQRDSIFESLKHLDWARFTQLEEYGRKNGKEEEIKEELYQQIYRNFLSMPGISWPLGAINNYVGFRDWFTANARDWNNDKAIVSSDQVYENYLHNNLPVRVEDYIKDELSRLLKNNHTNNMCLKTELSAFLTNIEERKNDEEQNAAGQDIQTATEGDIRANDEMIKYRRKRFLGISRGRPDVNYMRFFNGASNEIKDQTVDIATNTHIEDFKNLEPVKYDLKTEISGKNNISTTITFPQTDKRYPRKEIILTQGEISTLSKKILNCREIGDFKVRTHIVYNMLVSMIKIAEKKNLSLRYRVPWTPNQRELIMDDKNIVLYNRDDTGTKRRIDTLFDYNSFITTNSFHSAGAGDNRSLQTAIDELMGHFNYAMNEYHDQYRNATTSRLLKTKVSANGFWTSPIKTIMNLKTVRKFDFTTSAKSEDGKKSVEIGFEKNVITLKMWDIELKGKNLGKMLEYRKNKMRVFDGVERNIVFAFYDELVKKLRENSKINRGNYCVRDPLTQNIYTIDEDGKLHIISPEDPGNILQGRSSRIVPKTEIDDVDARWGRRWCNEKETKEAFMNPVIMGRMVKEMNRKMLRF